MYEWLCIHLDSVTRALSAPVINARHVRTLRSISAWSVTNVCINLLKSLRAKFYFESLFESLRHFLFAATLTDHTDE